MNAAPPVPPIHAFSPLESPSRSTLSGIPLIGGMDTSQNALSVRVSQRPPTACQECTRRKVKCDRKVPCSGCIRRSKPCSRETVLISKAKGIHYETIGFLHSVLTQLESSRDISSAIEVLRSQLARLEQGRPAAGDPTDRRDRNHLSSPRSPPTQSPGSFPRDAAPAGSTPSRPDAAYSAGPPTGTASTEGPHSPVGLPTSPPVGAHAIRQSSSALKTVEFLAWGRHIEACYPHRRCDCRLRRPYAELVSINVDPSWPAILHIPAALPGSGWFSHSTAAQLVNFHVNHILWHHGVFHPPTFLAQCREFWEDGTVCHPLWMALYLSVLSVSAWTIANGSKLWTHAPMTEATVSSLFGAMIQTLYDGNFLENTSLLSIQAIVISTRVAHNLDASDLNAVLVGAAIRMAHCLGIHKIEDHVWSDPTSEDLFAVIEAEIGRRCWYQLVIQDYFQIPFTDTYVIHPSQFSTSLPRNCDGADMIVQNATVPTLASYPRTLASMALHMPALLDQCGTLRHLRRSTDLYQQVMALDRSFRQSVRNVPAFLYQNDSGSGEGHESLPSWIPLARRSLTITAADKIIMIHRPVLLLSFQSPAMSYTRRTCVAAAWKILCEYETGHDAGDIIMWTHSAFCVTAIMVIGLELLHHSNHTDDQAQRLRQMMADTADRLRARRCDIMAERGAILVDALLSAEEDVVLQTMRSSKTCNREQQQRDLVNDFIGGNEILARFVRLLSDKNGGVDEEVETRWASETDDLMALDMSQMIGEGGNDGFDAWLSGNFL